MNPDGRVFPTSFSRASGETSLSFSQSSSLLWLYNNSCYNTIMLMCECDVRGVFLPLAWFTTLMKTEISQQLLDGSPWNMAQTFLVPSGWTAITSATVSSTGGVVHQWLIKGRCSLAFERPEPIVTRVTVVTKWNGWHCALALRFAFLEEKK